MTRLVPTLMGSFNIRVSGSALLLVFSLSPACGGPDDDDYQVATSGAAGSLGGGAAPNGGTGMPPAGGRAGANTSGGSTGGTTVPSGGGAPSGGGDSASAGEATGGESPGSGGSTNEPALGGQAGASSNPASGAGGAPEEPTSGGQAGSNASNGGAAGSEPTTAGQAGAGEAGAGGSADGTCDPGDRVRKELLADGRFEPGFSEWTFLEAYLETTEAQTSPNHVRLGGYNGASTWLTQTVAFPPEAADIHLSFYVRIKSINTSGEDFLGFGFQVGDTDAFEIHQVTDEYIDEWTLVELDYPATLAGQTRTFVFYGKTDDDPGFKEFYVDTVSLSALVCP